MSPKRRTIHEAGVTNPVKQSLKVRDTDRKVNYEEDSPIGNYAIHESIPVIFTNRIIESPSRGSDYRTISNRD